MIGTVGSIARLVTWAPSGPMLVHALTPADTISVDPKQHRTTRRRTILCRRRECENPPGRRFACWLMATPFRIRMTQARRADKTTNARESQLRADVAGCVR